MYSFRFLLHCLLLMLTQVNLAQKPTTLGDEFQVNAYSVGDQEAPAVASNPDGRTVIAYQSVNLDGDGDGIFLQLYDEQGNQVTGEIPANTFNTGDQRDPAVAMDLEGNFVVVWASNGQDGDKWGVYGQLFAADGTKTGNEFPVNSYTTNSQQAPAVAMNAEGTFVVVWESDGQDGSGLGVYGQRFNASGNKSGSEFRVNTTTFAGQLAPAISIGTNGQFVVVWTRGSLLSSGADIYGQRFDAQGNPQGSEFSVNTYIDNTQGNPDLSMNLAGDFVVVWQSSFQDGSEYGIYGQRYDANGTAQGGEFRINTTTNMDQRNPSVAIDADGNFVVVWRSQDQDGSGGANIYGQRYTHDGTKIGGEFPVSTLSGSSNYPRIAMNNTGDFVVAWRVFFSTGQYDVYCQRFNADGTSRGTAFQVESPMGGDEFLPDIAIDSAGNFTVVWATEVGEDDFEIWLESFTQDAVPMNVPINVISGLEDTGPPLIAMNSQANGVVTWRGLQDGGYGNFGRLFFFSTDQSMSQTFEFSLENMATNFFYPPSPVAAIDPRGNMVFVWRNDEDDAARDGIFAQRFQSKFPPVCYSEPRALSGPEKTYATYLAQTELSSDQVIGENAVVRYKAGSSIHLQPGFHAVAGTYFRAWIEDCTESASTSMVGAIPDSFSERNVTASVHPLKTLRLSLAPNPVHRELNLRLDSPESARVEIRIISLQGTVIFRKQIALTAGRNTHSIDLAQLPGGMYVLQTHGGPHQEQIKFVKY